MADDVCLLTVASEAEDGDAGARLRVAAEGSADGAPDDIAVTGRGGQVDAGDGRSERIGTKMMDSWGMKPSMCGMAATSSSGE